MEKVKSEKKIILFVSVLIATNTGCYILGKAMANGGEKDLFSMPLIIAMIFSIVAVVFSVFRKK